MSKTQIDSLKVDFQNHSSASGDAKTLEKIYNEFQIQYAFEGVNFDGTNKVTEKDSRKIIEGEKVSKYSDREIREIINHYGAFMRVQEMAKKGNELNEELVKDFHQISTDDIIQGGVYRNVNIQIKGSPKQPPHFEKVYDKMDEYFLKLKENKFDNIFQKAAFAHSELHKIHPFLDANGRVSRLVMNFILISNGYLPISIGKKSLKKYFAAIDDYKLNKTTKLFEELIIELLTKRYEAEIKKVK